MPTPFSHPLARHAKVWSTAGIKGKGARVLVVVTTLELDAKSKKFKADKVKKLADEAHKWVTESGAEATDYMLISRPKEWDDEAKFRFPSKSSSKPRVRPAS